MTLLRSAVFNAFFFGVTFLLGLAALPLRAFARSAIPAYSAWWVGLVLDAFGTICRVRVEVSGREYLPRSGPALLAPQHRSAFDTLIWIRLLPRCAYVMKAELTRIPLFGPLLVPSGQIAVERGAGASALRSLLRAADRAVADQRQIVIFPEGTRVAEGRQVPLQPGIAALSARLRLPVIPVATDSGRCWGRRAFRKRAGTIHIALGPPLPAGLPRAELLDRLRLAWEEAGRTFAAPVDKSVD
jgi:1-acyl-sn-glycerol-3-phosphate acyltransferase